MIEEAWRDLAALAGSDRCQADKNKLTLELLWDRFFLCGLCREHVARLVGLIDPRLYDCSQSTFVGERARVGLRKMLRREFCPRDLSADASAAYLQALASKVQSDLPRHAVQRLGRPAWNFVADHLPPGIAGVSHLQLHEHNCCEFVKNSEPEDRAAKGDRGRPTPQYAEWTQAAYPHSALWS